jgi:hypothetical protein
MGEHSELIHVLTNTKKTMKHLNKLPQATYPYIISSEDDDMYQVIEHGEVTAHIVETIDGTRQTLYFLDGGVRHFEDTDLHQVMSHVPSRTNFQMAWMWFEENGYPVLVDEGNGRIEINVVNMHGTDFIDVLVAHAEIDYRAELWIESRKG